MDRFQPIFKIFAPFLLGLAASFFAQTLLPKVMTIDGAFVLSWLIIAIIGVYFLMVRLKKASSIYHYVLWFLIGGLLVILHQPQNDGKHFAHKNADLYEVRVDQVNQSGAKTSKFLRCELSVLYTHDKLQKSIASGKILAFIDTAIAKEIRPKDVLLVNAEPERILNQGNPGEFDLQLFWKSKGFEFQWFLDAHDVAILSNKHRAQGVFERMRNVIVSSLSSHLDGDVFAVALGILLGDKTYLNLELKDAFSGAGAMHLLAVSGLHVGIFLVILQWLFQTVGYKLPRWFRFVCILGILWIYAGITGFSPSVNRAVTMFSFVALGTVFGRRYNSMNGLLASAMILLVIDPNYLFDIGFQLSYSAMIGIFLFSPLLEKAFYIRRRWLKFIWSGTAVALAAQLTTFPLTLYYFHQFPNYFLLTNLGLMLISWFIMAIGLGLIALGSVPFLGSLITFAFVLIVSALIAFVQWISELPFAITQGFRLQNWEMILLYVGIIILVSSLYQKHKIALYTSLGIFSFFVIFQSVKSIQDFGANEMLILNNNDPAFFIRRGKSADLLVISNKPDIETKMGFVKRSLDIFYGVDTKLHLMERKKGQWKTAEGNFVITHKNALVHLQYGGKWYTYIYGDYFRESDLMEVDQILLGPWVNRSSVNTHFENKPIWELKTQGAFKLKTTSSEL